MRTHTSKAPTARGQLPEHGYVRLNQFVPDVIPLSPATYLRRLKDGAIVGLPKPIKLGPRCVVYSVDDIRAFLASHGAAPVVQ